MAHLSLGIWLRVVRILVVCSLHSPTTAYLTQPKLPCYC